MPRGGGGGGGSEPPKGRKSRSPRARRRIKMRRMSNGLRIGQKKKKKDI